MVFGITKLRSVALWPGGINRRPLITWNLTFPYSSLHHLIMWTLHLLREKTAEEAAARVPAAKQAPVAAVPPQNTLPFTDDDISRFPALRSRNYWCIQRHQATSV